MFAGAMAFGGLTLVYAQTPARPRNRWRHDFWLPRHLPPETTEGGR